jgi:hypothetical protein
MSTPTLEATLGMILAVSIASERLVEIIKGYSKYLSSAHADPQKESHRKAYIQLSSVVAGLFTAFLCAPVLASQFYIDSSEYSKERILFLVAIGLLASGGSGFWNAILGYVLEVKNMKKSAALNEKNKSDPSLESSDVYPAVRIGQEPVSSNECYDVGE